MRPDPPLVRELAQQLLDRERVKGNDPDLTAAFTVCTKLGALLSQLAGRAGFRSLLSRALTLAQSEEPGLKDVRVLPDGRLEDPTMGKAGRSKDELTSTEVALVSHLFGLLFVLIGRSLTIQLVKEVWPEVSIDPEEPPKAPKK